MGILLGVIAMIGFGLSNAVSILPARQIGSKRSILYRNIITVFLLTIITAIFYSQSTFDGKYIILAFLIACLGYIPLLTFYKAMQLGSVGIISPVANSSVVFTVFFATVILKEHLEISEWLAISIIILGIILISINLRNLKESHLLKISSGVPFAIISSVLWGLVFFLFDYPVSVLGPLLTGLIIEFGGLLICAFDMKIHKISFRLPSRKNILQIFGVALCGVIGVLGFNYGISIANVSIVAAITFSNPLIASIYAKIVYKEKFSLQQWLAIVCIVGGIILISVNS